MAEPLVVTVKRYKCPFCSRGHSSRKRAAEHIARCWSNPVNRTCKICAHLDEGGDACGCVPGCNWGSPSGPVPPSCTAGVAIDSFPVTGCALWELREGALAQ